MNILLDLDEKEIEKMRAILKQGSKESPDDSNEQLFKKFEQAVDDGIDGLLNWIEIPEKLKDVPDGVTFGKFKDYKFSDATHYFKSIEIEK